MKRLLRKYSFRILIVCLLGMIPSMSVLASVTYTFYISEQAAEMHFRPLVARMVLSDEAVSAGRARNGQIESLVIEGGETMQNGNQITLAHLHNQFHELTVELSADRNVVTAITALISPSDGVSDNWVFHMSRPPHPTLDIHEILAYVRVGSIRLETTILPVPPTHYFSNFTGQWRRKPVCWICRYVCYATGRFCWIGNAIIAMTIVLIISSFYWLWRLRKS